MTQVKDMGLRGTPVDSRSKSEGPTDYGKGRVCTDCGVRICRYQPGTKCWQHEPKTYRMREPRKAS